MTIVKEKAPKRQRDSNVLRRSSLAKKRARSAGRRSSRDEKISRRLAPLRPSGQIFPLKRNPETGRTKEEEKKKRPVVEPVAAEVVHDEDEDDEDGDYDDAVNVDGENDGDGNDDVDGDGENDEDEDFEGVDFEGFDDDDDDDDGEVFEGFGDDGDNDDDVSEEAAEDAPVAKSTDNVTNNNSGAVEAMKLLVEQQWLEEELQLADEQLPVILAADLTREYQRMNTIDEGNRLGDISCNAGVFVVQRRADGLVCAEKRLRPRAWHRASHLREIRLLQRLSQPGHANIVGYIDACTSEAVLDDEDDYYYLSHYRPRHYDDQVIPGEEDQYFDDHDEWRRPWGQLQPGKRRRRTGVPGPIASLYLEYCTLGTLSELCLHQLTLCERHTAFDELTLLPEAFVWHVLRSLLAALVYLVTGSTDPNKVRGVRGWRPIVHRDINAFNVFLRPPPFAPPPAPRPATATSEEDGDDMDGDDATDESDGDADVYRATVIRSVEGDDRFIERQAAAKRAARDAKREAAAARAAKAAKAAQAAAATAAATSAYPGVVLGGFGLARRQPPDPEGATDDDPDYALHDHDDDIFFAGHPAAAEWRKAVLRHHGGSAPTESILLEDWSGLRDVQGVGMVARQAGELRMHFTREGNDAPYDEAAAAAAAKKGGPVGRSYSAQLNKALALALEPVAHKRLYAETMFERAHELFADVLPKAERIKTKCAKCAAAARDEAAAAAPPPKAKERPKIVPKKPLAPIRPKKALKPLPRTVSEKGKRSAT